MISWYTYIYVNIIYILSTNKYTELLLDSGFRMPLSTQIWPGPVRQPISLMCAWNDANRNSQHNRARASLKSNLLAKVVPKMMKCVAQVTHIFFFIYARWWPFGWSIFQWIYLPGRMFGIFLLLWTSSRYASISTSTQQPSLRHGIGTPGLCPMTETRPGWVGSRMGWSLKLTVRPCKQAEPPKGNSSSNHQFSDAMLVSGRVHLVIAGCSPWKHKQVREQQFMLNPCKILTSRDVLR